MDTHGRPPARDAAKDLDGPGDRDRPGDPGRPEDFDTKNFDRRRRARNWALLAVLLGLSVLFYAITLVKMSKSG
jgi:hypothetical protein